MWVPCFYYNKLEKEKKYQINEIIKQKCEVAEVLVLTLQSDM